MLGVFGGLEEVYLAAPHAPPTNSHIPHSYYGCKDLAQIPQPFPTNPKPQKHPQVQVHFTAVMVCPELHGPNSIVLGVPCYASSSETPTVRLRPRCMAMYGLGLRPKPGHIEDNHSVRTVCLLPALRSYIPRRQCNSRGRLESRLLRVV